MATCSVNTLLASNPCMAALPTYMVGVLIAEEWCIIGPNIHPAQPAGGIWNPDQPGPIYNPDQPGPLVNPDA